MRDHVESFFLRSREFPVTQKKSAPELGTDHIRPQPPCFPFETSTKRQRTDIRDSDNGEQPWKPT